MKCCRVCKARLRSRLRFVIGLAVGIVGHHNYNPCCCGCGQQNDDGVEGVWFTKAIEEKNDTKPWSGERRRKWSKYTKVEKKKNEKR